MSRIDAVKWIVDKAKRSKSKWIVPILSDIKHAFITAKWDLILIDVWKKGKYMCTCVQI